MKASGEALYPTSLNLGRKPGVLSPTCLSTLGKHGRGLIIREESTEESTQTKKNPTEQHHGPA